MRALLALVFMTLTLSAAEAQAPADGSVLDHYRAYRAAFDQGDISGAEAPAQAALLASQTQDGEGGRTGVLALNLALVKLWLGKSAEAYEPALLAVRIADTQGDASGVDPALAQLTLGRAEMVSNPAQGAERIEIALERIGDRTDLDEHAHAAALALGAWARDQSSYDRARRAFATAAVYARGASNPAYSHAVARTAEGALVIVADRRRHGRAAMREAYAILTEAMEELWPLALVASEDNQLTPAQRAFARAMAWRSIAADVGRPRGEDGDVQNLIGVVACHYRISGTFGDLSRFYPARALRRGDQGVIVVRVSFDQEGRAVGTQIAAGAPIDTFADSAADLATQFRLVRTDNSPPNCVMPNARFFAINFRL